MEFDWLGFTIGFISQPKSHSIEIMDLKEKTQKQVQLSFIIMWNSPRDLGRFEFHTPPCLALTLAKPRPKKKKTHQRLSLTTWGSWSQYLMASCFPGPLIKRTYHPLHHKPDRFPNRSLYSIPRQSPWTWFSSSPTKTMHSGMYGAGHENQILLAIVADILILMMDHAPSHDPCMQPRSLLPAACGSTSFHSASPFSDKPHGHKVARVRVPLVGGPIAPVPPSFNRNRERLRSPGPNKSPKLVFSSKAVLNQPGAPSFCCLADAS